MHGNEGCVIVNLQISFGWFKQRLNSTKVHLENAARRPNGLFSTGKPLWTRFVYLCSISWCNLCGVSNQLRNTIYGFTSIYLCLFLTFFL